MDLVSLRGHLHLSRIVAFEFDPPFVGPPIGERKMKLRSCVLAAFLLAAPLPAMAAQMTIAMHQSDVVRLEENAATVIVGNPLIADVSVLDGNLLVVQGRIFGTTSVIALDQDGNELLNVAVTVRPATQYALSLHLGPNTETYACAPICARIFQPGDEMNATEVLTTQTRAMQDVTQRAMSMGEE